MIFANIINEKMDIVGSLDLDPMVFDVPFNNLKLHEYVRWQRCLRRDRSGLIQKAKTRSEVEGAHRKIRRQKGTGGARHGDGKAPQWIGGGVAFGINPRSYGFKMNKKERALALASAVSHKLRNNGLLILENDIISKMDFTRTKNANSIKDMFGCNVLFVHENPKSLDTRGARLCQGIDFIAPEGLNIISCSLSKIVFCDTNTAQKFQNMIINRLRGRVI
jgi:large subunit ribosomal protein L4